jgi:hypothetical protein
MKYFLFAAVMKAFSRSELFPPENVKFNRFTGGVMKSNFDGENALRALALGQFPRHARYI